MFNYLRPAWESLDNQWQEFFTANCLDQLIKIDNILSQISQDQIIYPSKENIFRALNYSKPDSIKAVILGQDPYHGENQANGLAFAVNQGIKSPPSLINIFKELAREYQLDFRLIDSSDIEKWAQQGVLLLNTSLTVIKDQPNSLAEIGWQYITDLIIKFIANQNSHCVFLLWGNYARSKKNLIDNSRHLVLETVHPSPLSANRGFFGCNHFIKSNIFLEEHGLEPIIWTLNNNHI